MKIIHVLTDSNIGGAGVLLLNCLRYFDRENFDIKVVLPVESELLKKVKALSYEVIEIRNGRDKSFDVCAISELVKIFKAEKPDIVHTHASFSARIAARISGVPLVFQTHHCAPEPPKSKTRFPLKQFFGFIQNSLSDRIIATAGAAKDVLVRQGVSEKKITVIINGSEPLRVPKDKELSELRSRLCISESDFVVGIVARLEQVKNHKTFIEAAAQAVKVHPEMKFIILGKGSLEKSLKELACDLCIPENIVFCGFSEDIAPYVALFDINVNCSSSETSCLALSEGMSLGIPAVASSCEGNCAMVEDGVNGLLFDIDNSEALATAFIALAENTPLRKRLGENAKKLYEEKYTASSMTKQLCELYISEFSKSKKGGRKKQNG